jgi:hypothetical protein
VTHNPASNYYKIDLGGGLYASVEVPKSIEISKMKFSTDTKTLEITLKERDININKEEDKK